MNNFIVLIIFLQLCLSIYGFQLNRYKSSSSITPSRSNNIMICKAMIELQIGEFDKEVIQRYFYYYYHDHYYHHHFTI